MLAVIVVSTVFVFALICAYTMYVAGYKEQAMLLRNGAYGSLIFYFLLVLMCASIPEGM